MMDKQRHSGENDMGTLAEDARALMAATADVAGDKVAEARRRLAAALESGKQVFGRVRERAVEGAKAADELGRENPRERKKGRARWSVLRTGGPAAPPRPHWKVASRYLAGFVKERSRAPKPLTSSCGRIPIKH